MFKIKNLFVVVMAFTFCLPLFGCSKNEVVINVPNPEVIEFEGAEEIVFTAEKPICNPPYSKEDKVYKDFDTVEGEYCLYNDISEYYQENIKNKINGSIYLLKDRTYNAVLKKSFLLYANDLKNDKYVNPYITENFMLNEEKFGPLPTEELHVTGFGDTIGLKYFAYPVKLDKAESKFRLEFGNNGDKWNAQTYVNIYRGDICIATCGYYLSYKTTREPLTYKWFADYFKENLVLEA